MDIVSKDALQTGTELTPIHSKPKSHRWRIGIQAGYGLTFQQNTIKSTQYIGIGVTYNLLSFLVYELIS